MAAASARWRSALPVIIVIALAAVAPMLVLGSPDGHDFPYHLSGWMEGAQQWRSGVWWPLWAQGANYGFGEPRFIFYPPLSRVLGSIAVCLLPLNSVPGAYIFVVLAIAGLSMFALARQWLPPAHAILAAAFYTVNPYILLCVYQRSALAELLANAFCPLLLLCALRLTTGNKAIAPLALVFGLFWLSDLPAAVVVTYALALGIVVLAVVHRSFAILVRGAAAMLLGFALVAFFVLPAAHEQRWVHISDAISEDFRPENWEYTWGFDSEAGWFYAMVSGLVYAGSGLTALAAILSWRERRRCLAAWWLWFVSAAIAILMMFPTGHIFWTHAPELEFVQFPWRWLLVLSACLTMYLAFAMARLRAPWLAAVLLILAVLGGVTAGRTAVWHRRAATDLEADIRDAGGYEGGSQYMPPNAAPDSLYKLRAQPQAMAADAHARVGILRWAPEQKILLAQSPAPTRVVVRLLRYPGWQATVNGQTVETATDDLGRMVVPVPAGDSRVQISFTRTADRTAGIVISLVAVVILGLIYRLGSKKQSAISDQPSATSDRQLLSQLM